MTRRPVVGLTLLVAATGMADEARYRLPVSLAARLQTGRHSGLQVTSEPSGVTSQVTVSLAVVPLPGDPPLAAAVLDGTHALDQAAAGLRSPTQLATLIDVVAFVSRRVALDERDRGPQDAVNVLRRGRARCSGRTNLAVGLLDRLGVPARAVHGVLAGPDGARWHRWGEASISGVGWVPFDPGASVGMVGVRYLPLQGAEINASLKGVTLESVREPAYLGVPLRDGLRVVPVGGATLRCLAPDRTLSALLVGPDGSRWARTGTNEVVFAGLMPGRYFLRTTGAGWPRRGREIVLDGVREVRVDEGGAFR